MAIGLLIRALALLLAVPLAIAATSPATAQSAMTGHPVAVCVAHVSTGQTAATLFVHPPPLRCGSGLEQRALGAGDYWALSAPLRASGPQAVRVVSLWQHRLTLYARYADGVVLRQALDGPATSRHLQLGAIVEQRLPAREVPLVRLLWRVEGAGNLRGILVGARLATPEQSAMANLRMGTLYAAFAGLCVALLVYNLALWGALRHRFQLAYCAMVLALLVYACSSSGALAWAWPGLANPDRLRINYVALAASAAAAIAFARSFFEPRVFGGWLGRLCRVVCVVMLGTSLAFAMLAPWQIGWLDRLYSFGFLGVLCVVGPVLWRAWRTRSDYLRLFAIAWAAPIALAATRTASALSLLDYNFWIDNSTILTMTVEALLSGAAIAYRIRLLSVERDEARANEIAARLLADTDPLTGLLNRRAFLSRAIGREGGQTLLIADLDHFKQVNDTIGHDGGDEVLRVFARTLRQSVPPDALIARIGGEEFAVLTAANSAVPADDILARLRGGRMPFDVRVTASIGSCTGPMLREADWKALYTCADRALFEAKSAGRDRSRGHRLTDRIAA